MDNRSRRWRPPGDDEWLDVGDPVSSGIQYDAPAEVNRIPPYDPRSAVHYWAVGVIYRVEPATAYDGDGRLHMDMENLAYITPVACYYCAMPYSKRVERRRCNGALTRL